MSRTHWLLAACLSACAPHAPAESAAPVSPIPAARATPAPPSGEEASEPQLLVDRTLRFLSGLRELPPKSPVQARVITRERMLQYVEREFDRELPRSVVSGTEDMLFGFGTVAADFDYRESLLGAMQAALLGFYAPREKAMFLCADVAGPDRDATLFHELVHALQDQYYDLDKLLDYAPDASDRQAAIHALAEGDATSAMLDAMFAGRGLRATDLPDNLLDTQSTLVTKDTGRVPPIVQRSVVEPYVDGLAFVNALRRRGGWASVDSAWTQLPTSTEQLLHIDKYLAAEPAEPIAPPAPPEPSSKTDYLDVVGEEALRILFEGWVPAAVARASASGWAGDRIAVFSIGDWRWVGWHLRFDGPSAAQAALTTVAGAIAAEEDAGLIANARSAPANSAARAGQLCRERHTRGPFAAHRHGRDLGIVAGPFTRNPRSTQADQSCATALRWAVRIAE